MGLSPDDHRPRPQRKSPNPINAVTGLPLSGPEYRDLVVADPRAELDLRLQMAGEVVRTRGTADEGFNKAIRLLQTHLDRPEVVESLSDAILRPVSQNDNTRSGDFQCRLRCAEALRSLRSSYPGGPDGRIILHDIAIGSGPHLSRIVVLKELSGAQLSNEIRSSLCNLLTDESIDIRVAALRSALSVVRSGRVELIDLVTNELLSESAQLQLATYIINKLRGDLRCIREAAPADDSENEAIVRVQSAVVNSGNLQVIDLIVGAARGVGTSGSEVEACSALVQSRDAEIRQIIATRYRESADVRKSLVKVPYDAREIARVGITGLSDLAATTLLDDKEPESQFGAALLVLMGTPIPYHSQLCERFSRTNTDTTVSHLLRAYFLDHLDKFGEDQAILRAASKHFPEPQPDTRKIWRKVKDGVVSVVDRLNGRSPLDSHISKFGSGIRNAAQVLRGFMPSAERDLALSRALDLDVDSHGLLNAASLGGQHPAVEKLLTRVPDLERRLRSTLEVDSEKEKSAAHNLLVHCRDERQKVRRTLITIATGRTDPSASWKLIADIFAVRISGGVSKGDVGMLMDCLDRHHHRKMSKMLGANTVPFILRTLAQVTVFDDQERTRVVARLEKSNAEGRWNRQEKEVVDRILSQCKLSRQK